MENLRPRQFSDLAEIAQPVKAELGLDPRSACQPVPLALGKSLPNPLLSSGHFMGKKSLETPSPFLSGTAPHISLRDQRRQLSHDLPRILLLKKVLGMSLSSPAPHPQEAAGASGAEVTPLMRKIRRRGLDRALPGEELNGTLAAAPSGRKTWPQISVTPLV
ncbi:neuromedin-B isoform X2 [Panthera tigris]|uniref:neuromedin-B isoform X2 n=1 Tax=Panthera tigris TaxID=9694 RepID=UPI001C6FA398|nr:neuromedin-B isoform X2 [Panthera tigris]